MAVCPVFGGVGLIGGKASRPAGLLLLAAFAAAIVYLVRASRDHAFLESEEVRPPRTTRTGAGPERHEHPGEGDELPLTPL